MNEFESIFIDSYTKQGSIINSRSDKPIHRSKVRINQIYDINLIELLILNN